MSDPPSIGGGAALEGYPPRWHCYLGVPSCARALAPFTGDRDGQTPVHGTLAERCEHGRRLRKKASLEEHADLRGPADRDAVAIVAATDRRRVPELVPVRYERMLASPFAFLRGAAAVMAEDLRHHRSPEFRSRLAATAI